MAIRSKSLDDMIREIIISLRTGEPRRPAFTLLVGSGFSYPIIPTPTQMLRGDIAWWRYCKDRRFTDPFCSRAEGVSGGKATEEKIAEFEREMWRPIHKSALGSKETAFGLTADGLPDLTTPNAVGLAYQAVMADGLLNNKMRRQYLRDAIQRSHPKVNGAHIFLAGILEAQENWDWGAPFCRTIFTTNFDPLLQRSLQLVNKLYYMTDRPGTLEPPDDDQGVAIHLIYTHGSVHRYDLVNTDDQIKHTRERNAPTLIDYFRRHGVIVIGYSGWSDTTMEALSSCASFDSNLYWCDIHSAADAETKLRPEVLKVLEAQEKHAYYVPITGADEAMRTLHRELNLGPVPKFILDPVSTMITQLNSIDVASQPPATAEPESLSTSLKTLLDGTLTRLSVAKSAFEDPSIVRPATEEGEKEVARALIAQLLSDAFVAYSQGNRKQAIDLWSIVIATPGVPPKDRARALRNRGVAFGEIGEKVREIADYTAVIDMPDAPADQRAMALNNRGFTTAESDDTTNAIADFTSVIEMPDAPTDTKSMAFYNRGITLRWKGDTINAIADYTSVIDMPGVRIDQKAKALNNRGIALERSGKPGKAIDDYAAVTELEKAPADQKAMAFLNRGWCLFVNLDDAQAMIGDSRKALEIQEDNNARSNLALGLLLTGETDAAFAEYEALLSRTSDVATVQTAIDDLESALRKRAEIPEAAKILDRLRSALKAEDNDVGAAPA